MQDKVLRYLDGLQELLDAARQRYTQENGDAAFHGSIRRVRVVCRREQCSTISSHVTFSELSAMIRSLSGLVGPTAELAIGFEPMQRAFRLHGTQRVGAGAAVLAIALDHPLLDADSLTQRLLVGV
jgi:hypothetical protein